MLSTAHAESGGVRPFGVSLLMAGYDDNGPQLYQIDPSGSYFAWKASGGGKARGAAAAGAAAQEGCRWAAAVVEVLTVRGSGASRSGSNSSGLCGSRGSHAEQGGGARACSAGWERP